jgi:hypothetical protein
MDQLVLKQLVTLTSRVNDIDAKLDVLLAEKWPRSAYSTSECPLAHVPKAPVCHDNNSHLPYVHIDEYD